MGVLLAGILRNDERFSLCSAHDAGNQIKICRPGEMVVDFSSPAGFERALKVSCECGNSFFSGTTGITVAQKDKMKEAAEKIPLFYSPNMSVGINLIKKTLKENFEILKSFDIEIVEAHHKEKKDSPSGTALLLAEASGTAREKIHAIRAADIPGDHWIYLARNGELIEFHHRAVSREVFARGAIDAILWFAGQKAGLYSMEDFLAAASL
ncbi:4-hydroxy-tetrahydrodipicolinate reductase [candidate division WOR-3 bacterium]|nr:4-hydroxy-tetrahydrodipicolinate reductase [candidate division WOR-3 bacterium]